MNVRFESRFEKDLKLVKDRNLLSRLKQIILTCKQAESLGEINNLKKMQGYDSFYRVRPITHQKHDHPTTHKNTIA